MQKLRINYDGYAGSGKSTLLKPSVEYFERLLGEKPDILEKDTTRTLGARPEERSIHEYNHIIFERMKAKYDSGMYIAWPTLSLNRERPSYSAVLLPEYQRPTTSRVVFSVFGPEANGHFRMMEELVVNIFISLRSKAILRERLKVRCAMDKSGYDYKLQLNRDYRRRGIEREYPYVVYNDGTPEECLAQILQIPTIAEFIASAD